MPRGSNLLIAQANLADAGTCDFVGAEPAGWSATLPRANLLDDRTRLVARRAADDGTASVTLDLRRRRRASLVAVVNHNWTPFARWQVQFADDPAFPTDDRWISRNETGATFVAVSPPVRPWGQLPWGEFPWGGRDAGPLLAAMSSGAIMLIPQSVQRRFFRLDVDDGGNDEPLQAGRLILADAWVPRRNFAYGWEFGFVDDSHQARTPGGAVRVVEGDRRLSLNFELPALVEDDLFPVLELQAMCGLRRPFLLVMRPDARHPLLSFALYAVLTEMRRVHQPHFNTFAWSLTVEEWR